jgi:hypothetical protein
MTPPRAIPAKSTTTNITINMLSFRFAVACGALPFMNGVPAQPPFFSLEKADVVCYPPTKS